MDVTCIIGYFQKFLSFKKATTRPYGVNEYQISQVAQKWSSTSQICEYWSTCSQPYVSHIFHFQEMNYLYKVVSTCWTIQQAIYFRISSEFLKKRTFFKLNLLLWWKKFTPLLWGKYLHTPVSENLSLIIIFFWHRFHRENWIMMQGRRKLLSFVKKKNNLDGIMALAMRVAFGICGPGLSFFSSPLCLCATPGDGWTKFLYWPRCINLKFIEV